MADKINESCQDVNQSGSLEKTVEIMRARFSKVRVETSIADGDTAFSVRFLGSGENLPERQVLVSNLVHYLPQALSVIGVGTNPKPGDQKDTVNHPFS